VIARVMTHPTRAHYAQRLASRLTTLESGVVVDPDPSGEPNAYRTFLHVMRSVDQAEPLLVLQDDAVPCVGFERAVQAAWRAAGDRSVLVLYAGQALRAVPLLRAAAAHCRSLVELGTREYVPTVATVYPAGFPRAFAEYAERNAPPGWRHDDEMVGAYCRDYGVEVLTTIPCLAQHDNTLASIAGHAAHGPRSAWCWAHDVDASSIRWTR
jgi:hypothetical protein